MPNATASMPNRATVPCFFALYPTVAAAALSDGLAVLLAAEAFMELDMVWDVVQDVAWTAVPVPVAEAVLLIVRVTPWAAQSFFANSSVSGSVSVNTDDFFGEKRREPDPRFDIKIQD